MAKLVQLVEAAEQLGITPEQLTEMVDKKEIFGYRDGTSWKFKPTEIERVASDKGLGGVVGGAIDSVKDGVEAIGEKLGLGGGDDDMIDVDELQLDDDSGDDADSILISEEELGRSDESTSSTIIGKAGLDAPADSDINIAAEEEEVIPMPAADSDLTLAAAGDSDLSIASDGGSDLGLAEDSDLNLAKESTSDVLAGDSDLLPPADGGTGAIATDSGIDLTLEEPATGNSSLTLEGGSDALSLDDDDLKLDADSGMESGIGADSSIDLDLDDDDLLAGSGMGSDITLGASDSGINLANPSDSGISLEDVGSDIGSGIDSSLELGDEIELEADPADPADATELQTDDEFMLTPVAGDGELDEESDDSGSQVIALDSDEFDESSATMLVPDDDPLGDGGLGAAAAVTAGAVTAGAAVAAVEPEEAGFSVWNIVGLVMLATFMGICSLLAMDVLRNIWTWDQPFSISGSLMNLITGM